MSEETKASAVITDADTVGGWVEGEITEGDRRGSIVLVAPLNPAGIHQVIFATGASGWYLPEDIRIKGLQRGEHYVGQKI